ncbi:MAG: methyl-accepting chemotaxis protein [Casimicrobiaceae bacterium]
MALVKSTKISPDARKSKSTGNGQPPAVASPANPPVRRKADSTSRETISERVAAATEELASGLTEASAATRELERSMEQIASGAQEAAGAAEEQSAAIRRIVASFTRARTEAETSGRRTDAIVGVLDKANARISAAVRAIERNSERQLKSVAMIAELERGARDIGQITLAVSRISDQTNLLALNAAIEAARAGEHGRGFAVVADEVRTLAENSDKSAQQVQRLAESIQVDVRGIVEGLKRAGDMAVKDSKLAAGVGEALAARRNDMMQIAEGSREVLTSAVEAETASVEAQKGAEQVASAAEEQSSGGSQAQLAVAEQAKSLEQAHVAAQTLAVLAENLRKGKAEAEASEEIGAAAEELSATIQELSGAATEVMSAVEQISRAAQLQASATQQTSAALSQIENSARVAERTGQSADARIKAVTAALQAGRGAVDALIAGIVVALDESRASLATTGRLADVGRQIEKIVDGIALIVVQTGMLAVSGSVEAARSGDAGRGFAVVSSDIRTLAREAAENVERAKDTVRAILDQIATLKRDMEQIIMSAEGEVESNRSIPELLQTIAVEVEGLGVASKAIVEGAETILTAAVETAKGARQVAAAAEEAGAASREAATAATQQSSGAEDLAAAIEEIASLADELKRLNG